MLNPFPEGEEALALFERLNKLSIEDKERNIELNSKIYISYYNEEIGNIIESDEATEEIIQMVKDTSGISTSKLINAYQWIQQFERKRGNLINANELNKKYVELELANGANDVEIGLSYLELGSGYRILGDYENSIKYPTKAFELFNNAPDSLFSKKRDKNFRLWRSLQIRGLSKKDLKNYEGAISDYDLSIDYLKKSNNYDSLIGKKYRIDCFARLAHVQLLNDDLTNATKSLEELALVSDTIKFQRYRYYELNALLSLKQQNYFNTKLNIQKAIEYASIDLMDDKESPEIARLRMTYGDYFVAIDSISLALNQYHLGLQYIDENLDDNPSNNPDISIVDEGTQTLQLLEKKAETFLKLFAQTDQREYLIDGLSTFNSAIDLIDKMKSDFINEGSKYRVAEFASSIYPKALEANYTLYQIDKDVSSLNSIFNIIEKNKAEILFQSINSKYNLLASALPNDFIKKGIDLRYNISYYSKVFSEEKLKSSGDEKLIKKYEDKLFELNEALTFHDQNIKDNYLDFYKFINEISNIISTSDLQNVLQEDQLILEYFQTKDYLYTVYITTDKVAVKRIPMTELKPNLVKYFEQISQRPDGNSKNAIELNNISFTLAKQLILEGENYLSNYKKIIIIPDGFLSRIPFESLVINNSGRMLIDESNIAYNYSASQYLENKNSPLIVNPRVLCLTPSFEGYRTEERSCNSSLLGDLPNAKKEYNNLKENFIGSFFEGKMANSTHLKENFSDFQIIHLATHACLNNDDPMLSQIYFSDGAMTNYDIQNLNSRPELVVLSACNTASGHIKDGEGVISLSRGFFEAGVRGLQSSLWSIDDYSSSEIVQGMYHHLKSGKSKSEALRLSKLDYLKSSDKLRSHPYYWAAMIHIGNDNPMIFSNDKKLYYLFGILILSTILIGLYFYFRRS